MSEIPVSSTDGKVARLVPSQSKSTPTPSAYARSEREVDRKSDKESVRNAKESMLT